MFKTEACFTGVLPVAAGLCYSRGLLVPSACLSGLVALYHVLTCTQPSAKSLLARVHRVLPANASGLKLTAQVCTQCFQVTPLMGENAMWFAFCACLWLEPVFLDSVSAAAYRLPTSQAHLNPHCPKLQMFVHHHSRQAACVVVQTGVTVTVVFSGQNYSS